MSRSIYISLNETQQKFVQNKTQNVLSRHTYTFFLTKLDFPLRKEGIPNTFLQYIIGFVRILFIKRVLLIRYTDPDNVYLCINVERK